MVKRTTPKVSQSREQRLFREHLLAETDARGGKPRQKLEKTKIPRREAAGIRHRKNYIKENQMAKTKLQNTAIKTTEGRISKVVGMTEETYRLAKGEENYAVCMKATELLAEIWGLKKGGAQTPSSTTNDKEDWLSGVADSEQLDMKPNLKP